MVGVSGISKGCNTCRKRKIGCDLAQPECGQCIKSNRPCLGYRREIVFKHSGLADEGSAPGASNKTSATTTVTNTTTVARRGNRDAGVATRNARSSGARTPRQSGQPIAAARSALSLPKAVHPKNAYRAQILSVFIDGFLPEAEKTYDLGSRRSISWLQVVTSVPEQGDALSSALTALALARLGRLHHDARLAMDSKVLYSTALSQLQRALSTKSVMFREDTLGACLALEMYEMLECSGDGIDGWMIHCSGTAQLVRSRGPSLHQSALSHQLFLGVRTAELVRACASRKSTFLVESRWQELPWKNTNKTIDDELYDVMAHLPALFEQADNVKNIDDGLEVLAARLELIERCWNVHKALKDWYERAHEGLSAPQYWPQFSALHNPVDEEDASLGKVFPTSLHYPNVRVCIRYLHYWTSIILVCGSIRGLYISLKGAVCMDTVQDRCAVCSATPGRTRCRCGTEARLVPFDVDTLPAQPTQADFHCCADGVSQSVEYCLRQESGHFGSLAVIFPLRVASQCYRYVADPRPLRWARAAMETLSTMKQLPFGQHMEAAEWGHSPKMTGPRGGPSVGGQASAAASLTASSTLRSSTHAASPSGRSTSGSQASESQNIHPRASPQETHLHVPPTASTSPASSVSMSILPSASTSPSSSSSSSSRLSSRPIQLGNYATIEHAL